MQGALLQKCPSFSLIPYKLHTKRIHHNQSTKINLNPPSTDDPFKSSFSTNESGELEPPELQKALLPIPAAIHFLNTITRILKCPLDAFPLPSQCTQ